MLEAIPNVGVGRDQELVERLAQLVRDGIADGAAIDGSRAVLADVHRDSDHDRSVFTIVGRGAALDEAVFALARGAVAELDLHAGHGVHPRVGVLDVLPFVALDGDPLEAHRAAQRAATRIGDELAVPVVAYGLDEDGAPRAGAGFAGAVRRGGPATVLERVAAGELELLAGPAELHPTAGVTLAGARGILVACNVELDVDDLELARTIAARIRAAADGPDALPGVRALGLRLASRQVVQVSTNVEQPLVCGPARVLETVARIADELGAGVSAFELVGLAPDAALVPLRYACTRAAVPLSAAFDASIEAAVARV